MTEIEKEIIIDGVDVTGCNFFIEDYQRANNIEGRYEHCKNVCELNGDNYFYCEMNKDCYFKQLKCLQQENEELKEKLDFKNLYALSGKCFFDSARQCNYFDDFVKTRKALEEIRDIAEKLITETPEYHSCYYKDECGDKCTPKQQNKVTYCCYENVEKIENLINEVLNVENN